MDPAVDKTRQPYAYAGNNPVMRTDHSGLDPFGDAVIWLGEAADNVRAFGYGAADQLTGGASSMIMGYLDEDYECFIEDHSDAFGSGQVVAGVAEVVIAVASVVVTAGASAGAVVAWAATKMALKASFHAAVTVARKEAVDAAGQAAVRGGSRTAASEMGEAGPSTFAQAKRDLGPAGPGNVYDHVVDQSQIARSNISPTLIHSAENLNPVSAQVNQLKANWYSRSLNGPGSGTIRDWLSGQSFEDQLEYGRMVTQEILRSLNP